MLQRRYCSQRIYYPKRIAESLINQLHHNFVLTGSFDANQAAFFSRLMQERIDDEYSDFMIINEEEVLEYIEPAKEYVTYIEKLIEEYFCQDMEKTD